jgi:transposase
MNQSLSEHYQDLLLLPKPWQVTMINKNITDDTIEVFISWPKGLPVACAQCSKKGEVHDYSQERCWKHLNVMQYRLNLRCAIPRCRCPQCGIKNITVPWAEPNARYTFMFEEFALAVIIASRNLTQAAILLKVDWDVVQRIMTRAVERGLVRRNLDNIANIGLDEKSFLRGQNYVSLMTDLDKRRIIDVVPGHKCEDILKLWQVLEEEQLKNVKAVAMDMSGGFIKATEEAVPHAKIVVDRFHISKHVNDAVNSTRIKESNEFNKKGDNPLKGSRFLFLKGTISEEQQERFSDLLELNLKTAEAWAYKEQMVEFWSQGNRKDGKAFLDQWYAEVNELDLPHMKRISKMLKKHEEYLLNYFDNPITNALAEGFNSAIQAIKSAARGFRNFANYRTRILFFCGKLNLMPESGV